MRIQITLTQTATLVILAVAAISGALSKSEVVQAQTINASATFTTSGVLAASRIEATRALEATLLSFTAVLSPSVAAQSARDKLETIQFPPGRTTTVLKGTLLLRCKAEAENCDAVKKGYALPALAGQTLTLKLSPSGGNVIINDILGIDGKSVIPTDADEDFWYGWPVKLKQGGEDRIYVSTTETAKRVNSYALNVTLK